MVPFSFICLAFFAKFYLKNIKDNFCNQISAVTVGSIALRTRVQERRETRQSRGAIETALNLIFFLTISKTHSFALIPSEFSTVL